MFDASNPLLVCRSQSVTVADGRIRVLSNTFGQIQCRSLSSVLSQIHRQVKDALPTPGKELFCLTINKNRGEEVKRYLTANTRFGRKSLSSALLLQLWERKALLRAPAIRPVLGQQNSRHEGGSQPNHRHELDMCSLCLSYSLLCRTCQDVMKNHKF